MSRRSDAKRTRRRKRQAGRDARWLDPVEVDLDGLAEEVAAAAAEFDGWISSRGWLFDADNATDEVISWVYPPSAAEVADGAEPVTRVWLSITGDDDDFPRRVNAVLVGTGANGEGLYRMPPASLVDDIEALESHRPGEAAPDLR